MFRSPARASHADPSVSCVLVALVIPLVVQTRPIGVWLLGRRDPDDYFPASDVQLLSTVANQLYLRSPSSFCALS